MSLKQKTISGVVWSGLEKFATLFIQLISTIFIARLLSPSDFGLIGMLTVFLSLAQVLIESGFSQALIRQKNANDIDFSSVFYLNIVIGIVVYSILFYLSPFIAYFYKTPDLDLISKVAFLVIPINAFGFIQFTLLNKEINFKSLAKVTILSAVISGILGIGFAIYLKNVWALVIQNLSFYFLRTLFLWIFSSWVPLFRFSLNSIKSLFSFSFNLLLTGLISSVFNNLYSLVIGRIYNSTQLGYYTQADRFQKLPSTSITDVIQRVSFPVLTKIQDDNEKLREGYRKIIGMAVFIVVPIMFFLIGVASDLFDLVLTPKWNEASIYFQILCFIGALYPLHSINLNILNVKGNSRKILLLEITRKSLLVVVIIISSHFEIYYMVIGQALYSFIVLFLNLYFCGKEIQLSVKQQLKDLAPSFLISITMLIFLFLIHGLIFKLNIIIIISFQFIFALTYYYILNWFFKVSAFIDIRNIILNYIKK